MLDTKLKIAMLKCQEERLEDASDRALDEIERYYSNQIDQFLEDFYSEESK